MALVLLRRYSTASEADVARSFLASHGIKVFRFDPEDYVSTLAAPGIPPRLMVVEEQLDEAETLLTSIEA